MKVKSFSFFFMEKPATYLFCIFALFFFTLAHITANLAQVGPFFSYNLKKKLKSQHSKMSFRSNTR